MTRQPIFKVIYLNNDIDKKIIREYWEVDTKTIGWRNTVQKIAEWNSTSMRNVSSYTKENSRFELYCTECENLIVTCNLRSGINWFDFLSGSEIRCESCQSKPQVNIVTKTVIKEVEPVFKSAKKMNIAFKTEQWLNLNQPELEVLIKVAESKTRSEVYSKVFPDENLRSQYNLFYWRILNRLDDLNLIWIDREDDGSIIQFHTHGNLYNTLLKEYPDLVMKRKAPKLPKAFGFSLKKHDKDEDKEPDFTGQISARFDVEIKAVETFECAVWYNKIDGIYVRIIGQSESAFNNN